MAQTTISHIFARYSEVVHALADLQNAGVPMDDVDLIESDADVRLPPEVAKDIGQSPAVAWGMVGLGIGGGIGVLVGIGAIPTPALASVVQASWALSIAIGACLGGAAGAIVGAVTKLGVTTPQAHAIAKALQRGQYLVMVHVDDGMAAQVQALLLRPRAVAAPAAARPAEDPVAAQQAP